MRAKCERMRTEARSEERSFKMEDLEKGHGGECVIDSSPLPWE